MSSERVDKQWKEKGLSQYSTPAILGTLKHYGVAIDEAGLEAAGEKYPLELAQSWKPSWKGTGQFALFPYAAADELLRRLFPERATPMQVANALVKLMAEALKILEGTAQDLAAPLAEVKKLEASLPAPGDRRDVFNSELIGFLDTWGSTFNDLPKRLATAGKREAALQFGQVQEAIFTERAGVMSALVEAICGDRAAAVRDLVGKVVEDGRDPYARYAALDALVQLDELDVVKHAGLTLFDAVEQAQAWALADSIAHLLAHVAEKDADRAFRLEVRKRLERAHVHTGHGH